MFDQHPQNQYTCVASTPSERGGGAFDNCILALTLPVYTSLLQVHRAEVHQSEDTSLLKKTNLTLVDFGGSVLKRCGLDSNSCGYRQTSSLASLIKKCVKVIGWA